MKKIIFSTLFVLQIVFAIAQTTSGVTGKVVDSKTQKPMQSVIVSVQNTNLMQLSDSNGKFSFDKLDVGSQIIRIRTNSYKEQLLQIEIKPNELLDIGTVNLEEDITTEQQLTLITITDNDLSDDNSGSESTAGLLQASRDVFLQAAAYNFGQARFSVRGIDNEYSNILINGISMNRLSDGRPQYSNWGGLNDATRNQEFTNASAPSDYTFGGIAGTQYISTRASVYRPGTRISFLSTNTNYNFRAMATHASGMDKNGWAYVISGGRRWAQDGYFDGTDYAANSLFASIEKKINDHHSLNFTSIYAQNRRGKNSPNTQEVTDLKNFKYNSYWGYQEGEKRNSRVKDVEEPIFTLSHYWKFNSKTRLHTNLSYQFGEIGNSRIDFQKADNPDPNYYKKLPSYYTTLYSYDRNNVATYTPDYAAAEETKANFLAQPQMDWTSMYRINNDNISNGSRYVLYEDRTDDKTMVANTILSSQLADNIVMNAGASFTKTTSSNFKNLIDLLGGTYYNDINTFGTLPGEEQSDLNNPNRTVGVGDKYGYNYTIDATRLEAFTQFKFTYDKIDFYLGQSFSKSSYQREGLYKNGYYPDNSFGKSTKMDFDNFGFKGGATYKITGQHYFDVNAVYMTKAPNHKDVFPNARLNNDITDNIKNETINSVDASYIIRMPKLKARFTAYFNETENTTDISFYYADNISVGNGEFVSEVVSGQNKRNKGIEAGIEYQFTSTLKATAIAAYGDYTYTNNPNLVIHADGVTEDIFNGPTNMQGYKLPGMPQQAYSAGLEYRDPKFWWIGANVNYLSNNYLDVAPLLRTSKYITDSDEANFPYDAALSASYLAQEKFNAFTLVNLVGGKTWRIQEKTLGLFANVNNVFDIQYKTGGFEQARNASYSELYKDHSGPTRSFGPKYFYGYGRTFMVNIYLNF
ncbi:carboxypeptidase-like regulatory domain-containing protein [Flavobacterium nackdongense]|uniref:TonB-dependent receptor n=1 Tax=Flavobacterium nackdongense TaxID=2547394 RepID=A0A4P6Y8Y9_9FLAO|nr:carboxypeptidase-like regulatory domain-containing protein [Flavobacterium nackdongense]QBN19401.1 TonB-dependent receptor [Flavobacterium nackdongense]